MDWVVKLGEQSQPVKTSRSHAVSRWKSQSLPCRGREGAAGELHRDSEWETQNLSLRDRGEQVSEVLET